MEWSNTSLIVLIVKKKWEKLYENTFDEVSFVSLNTVQLLAMFLWISCSSPKDIFLQRMEKFWI